MVLYKPVSTDLSHHAFFEKHFAMNPDRQPTRTLFRIALAVFIATVCISTTSQAQVANGPSLHWAYASYFGTGWYSVGSNRNAFVVRMTPRWEYREASLADDGERRVGVYFKLPVTAGLETFQLDDLPGILDPDNLASLSVTPGIDIEIPVTQRFTVRPFAAVGWGSTLNGSDSAWTYWTGVRSRYSFQTGKLDWALLNSVAYVGYAPSSSAAEDFWPLMIGLEFQYPLGRKKQTEDSWLLYWHGTYTSFQNDLDFTSIDGLNKRSISDEWELAIALGKREKPIRVWFLKFDRLGLGYRTSSDGELRGITVIFRSLFDL